MKKIPTLFVRDWHGDRSRVTEVPNPDCQWVFDGAGVATIKLDGTACMVRNGHLYKRMQVRIGGGNAPKDFEQVDLDAETGKIYGWMPVTNNTVDQWHREAWARPNQLANDGRYLDGTYELCGPKVQGNPEDYEYHVLLPHGFLRCNDAPRDYVTLGIWLSTRNMEGVVWQHEDGRMAKIKKSDYGLPRKPV